jgi:hypothetical protein
MFELINQLVNEAHRQDFVRDAKQERKAREARLARQDEKRERQYHEVHHKTVRKVR